MLNLIEGPALFGLLGLVPFVGGVLLLPAAVLGMGMGGVKFTLAARPIVGSAAGDDG
jgi:hypothetical protein